MTVFVYTLLLPHQRTHTHLMNGDNAQNAPNLQSLNNNWLYEYWKRETRLHAKEDQGTAKDVIRNLYLILSRIKTTKKLITSVRSFEIFFSLIFCLLRAEIYRHKVKSIILFVIYWMKQWTESNLRISCYL